MKEKAIKLLGELKNSYSKKLLDKTLESLQNITNNDFDDILTNEPKLFLNQDDRFYDALAFQFAEDLNHYTLIYFDTWETLTELIFDTKTRDYFYNSVLNIDAEGDATNYINSFIHLRNESPEIALFHLNRIDHYIACYFIGLCYLLNENYENAIKNYLFFLDKLHENTVQSKASLHLEEFTKTSGLIVTKWSIYNDLGYCYNRVKEFENALTFYNKSLEIFDLSENFKLNSNDSKSGYTDEFAIFVNNYLLALEKNQDYSTCIGVLDFVIEKIPEEYYYQKLKKSFEEKLKNQSFGDNIIKQLFKPKKAFDIGNFEHTKVISKEKNLEDMIVEQIKYGFKVFDKDLEIYQDAYIFGRQYYISSVNGFLDLLLIDKKTNVIYVVELKRNEAGIEVVAQTEKYIYGLKHELENEIKGIICLHKPNTELIELVKKKDNIELYTYNFEFKKM